MEDSMKLCYDETMLDKLFTHMSKYQTDFNNFMHMIKNNFSNEIILNYVQAGIVKLVFKDVTITGSQL